MTAGNPLFLDGIVRVLIAEHRLESSGALDARNLTLPDSVREAIHRRLSLLSADARELMLVAAAIGLEFDSSLLAHASHRNPAALFDLLQEAIAIGVARSLDESRYAFAHPMHRETLYAELAAEARAEIHRAIAEALENLYQHDLPGHLAELAHHRRLCGDDERAIAYSIRAGAAAMLAFAYEDAVLHWRVAVELMERRGDSSGSRAKMLERLGDAMTFVDSEQANRVRVLESAAAIYRELGDDVSLARVYTSLGSVFVWTVPQSTEMPRAMEYLRKAEAILAGKPEGPALAAVYLAMAQGADYLVRYDDGLKWASRAKDIAIRLNNRAQAICADAAYGEQLLFEGRLREAVARLGDSVTEAQKQDSPDLGWRTALALSTVGLALWDPLFCLQTLNAELASQRTANASFFRRGLELLKIMPYRMSGQLKEARAMLSAHEPEPPTIGQLLFAEGEWERALESMSRTAEQQRTMGNLHDLQHSLSLVSRIQRSLGRLDEAMRTLEEAVGLIPDGDPHVRMEILPEIASLSSELGVSGERYLEPCRSLIATGEDWRGIEGNVVRAEAIVAAARGDYQEAERQFSRAVDIFRRYTLPFEAAETLEQWAIALAKTGELRRRDEKFGEAAAIYARLGVARWVEQVAATRQRVASSPKPPSGEYPTVFRRSGSQWMISYDGSSATVRDSKGLNYLAQLMQSPGNDFHVLELAAGGTALGASDAHRGDPILDARAKAEYRSRLAELHRELEGAEESNDRGQAERLRAEIESLNDQLSAALGLGGRDRRANSNAERARSAVGKNIRSAIKMIEQVQPSLGRHLTASIRTGYFCSYRPERTVAWQF